MPVSLLKIAKHIRGSLEGDADKIITGAAPFETAGEDDITYAGSPKFLKNLSATAAGAVIVPKTAEGRLSTEKSIIFMENPARSFCEVILLFHPRPEPDWGISPNAHVGKDLLQHGRLSVAPLAYIGHNVSVGDGVVIHPHAMIGDHVTIGDNTEIFPHVAVLERCVIGSRVIIHAGTVIGSDGFGFVPDGGKYYKIPHTGIVRIEDDVEIGANNTIDRATFGITRIGRGVKTDNLVHVAHNVTVGNHTVLVAQVGIAGSATIGNHATLAGQVGVAGHLTIGDNATVGPQAGVARNIPAGETVSGSPELPHKRWLRVQQVTSKLPEMKKKVSDMERRLVLLEEMLLKDNA